jgi:hypothetical protein
MPFSTEQVIFLFIDKQTGGFCCIMLLCNSAYDHKLHNKHNTTQVRSDLHFLMKAASCTCTGNLLFLILFLKLMLFIRKRMEPKQHYVSFRAASDLSVILRGISWLFSVLIGRQRDSKLIGNYTIFTFKPFPKSLLFANSSTILRYIIRDMAPS